MRTALWETSTGALAALLNSGAPLNMCDLYTLTLLNGTAYYWSGSDVALFGNGRIWTLGPGLTRTKLRVVVGVAVDDMTVTVTDIKGTSINGVPLMAFIRSSGLKGARLQVDRAFWGVTDTAPVGALEWFTGRIRSAAGDRFHAELTVVSDLEALNVMVPRDVYQMGCRNTVFDSACGLAKSAYTVTGATTSATDSKLLSFNHALAQAAGWFDMGVVTMTSGPNAGISRSVRLQTTGFLTVLNPWPFAVGSGDTFSIIPGCDGTQALCTNKFSNVIRYRGFPFIPTAETVM